MTQRWRVGVVVALFLAPCAGCGKRQAFYAAQGKVFLDGKPAEGALVVLHPATDAGPDSIRPTARVAADGTFTLNSYVAETRVTTPGAPPGEYVVTITWLPPDVREYVEKNRGGELPDKLQGKYASAATSPLPHATVRDGPTEIPPFELKSAR
jgi:hypothetical protein